MEFCSLDFESTSVRKATRERSRARARDRHLKMSMKYLTTSVNVVYDSVFLLPKYAVDVWIFTIHEEEKWCTQDDTRDE